MAATADTRDGTIVADTQTLNPTTKVSSPTTSNPSIDVHHQSPQTAEAPIDEPPNLPATAADNAEIGAKRKRNDDDQPPEDQLDPKSSLHPLYKTSLCSFFRRLDGSCSHGEGCRFAHGEEELRMRPDNTWDPTSERAKKIAKRKTEEKGEDENGDGGGEEEQNVMMTEVMTEFGGLCKCLHLPRAWSSDYITEFLTEQGVPFKSAKKKKGMALGFVSFESDEQMESATEVLKGVSVGGKNVKIADVGVSVGNENVKIADVGVSVGNENVKIADVMSWAYDDKTKAAWCRQSTNPAAGCETDDVVSSNDLENGDKMDVSASKIRSVRDVVTPLAHMPYTEQLEHKKNSLMQILKRLTRNARKACPSGISFPEWIIKSREIGGLPCKLEGIIGSPLVNGYRNKCEFSVGHSVQGRRTVGFMLGNFRDGVTAVGEPVDCPNVSPIACRYASIFQDFLQNSALPLWNRFNNTGFWRQLTVREGRDPQKSAGIENPEANISEVLLMIQICSVGFDSDLMDSELKNLSEAFATGAASSSPPLPLTTFVIQDHIGISNVAPPDAPLRQLPIPTTESETTSEAASTNEAWIHDYINNLRFRISPTAFFQVNTLAAEKLYSLAGDWAGLGPDTLLFDVCCGTGTIGLTLANRVGMVVGIEMNASAVSDAQRNAEINGIKNCRFVCSKAEDVIDSLLKEYLIEPKQQDQNPVEVDDDKITPVISRLDSAMGTKEVAEINHASACTENGEELRNTKNVDDQGNEKLRSFTSVVAIVDPPRAGLHPTVIKTLRRHALLRRLVYISCNPETLVANAIELCTPSSDETGAGNKKMQGWRKMSSAGQARQRAKAMPKSEPFQPVKAMAVDLFPHTPHCEMVMLLER